METLLIQKLGPPKEDTDDAFDSIPDSETLRLYEKAATGGRSRSPRLKFQRAVGNYIANKREDGRDAVSTDDEKPVPTANKKLGPTANKKPVPTANKKPVPTANEKTVRIANEESTVGTTDEESHESETKDDTENKS